MPPAIIGGAIAAVGAVGSAVIGGNAAKSAANASSQAADASAQVQRDIYAQNKQTLTPFVNTGTAAMGNINALLGIAPQQGQVAPQGQQQGIPAGTGISGHVLGNALTQQGYTLNGNTWTPPAGQTGTVNTVSQPTAQQAFDTYRNSTGYQFRMGQGLDAVNSGYAGAGTLKSGAAMQGINDYAQGMASQEFGNYMGALGNQQALGMSGASALAGVGQGYANSLGNIYQQNGANQANAALLKGQNTAGALNSLATIGAGIFGGSR